MKATTRALNENTRNLAIERTEDDTGDGTLMSTGEFLLRYLPHRASLFSNGFDQWMASYWRHLGKRELRSPCGDGDWDFGHRVYPLHALQAVGAAWDKHKSSSSST